MGEGGRYLWGMSQNPTHRDEDPGFLDAASGIPMSARTRHALNRSWGLLSADPSRRYPAAADARRALARARESVASGLGRTPNQIAFHPGTADEAMSIALRGAVTQQASTRRSGESVRVVLSAVEELGVLRAADNLAAAPPSNVTIDLMIVPVEQTGRVDSQTFVAAIGEAPAVVVLQAANGEIGTRQPVHAVSTQMPPESTLVVDARHCAGRADLPNEADLLIAHAPNWGGPPGLAIIAASSSARLTGLASPTDGPLGLEPVNPPVPLVAAAGLSLEEAIAHRASDEDRSTDNTDLLRSLVAESIPDAYPLGHPTDRLPHIVMFSFLYVAADELVDNLGRAGWSVASGSACTSDTNRPLHVLEAIGALTHGNLRVSLPPWTTSDTIRAFAADLADVISRLRSENDVSELA